jgi:hypothetical protein
MSSAKAQRKKRVIINSRLLGFNYADTKGGKIGGKPE